MSIPLDRSPQRVWAKDLDADKDIDLVILRDFDLLILTNKARTP